MSTAVNLMLLAPWHNPCATTIVTMRMETRSLKRTTLGDFMPPGIAFAVTHAVAQVARMTGLV